jgi:peptide/nickel transport system permease protein
MTRVLTAPAGAPKSGRAPAPDGRLGLRVPGYVLVVVRRLILAVPLLFVTTLVSFVLESLIPGDAAHTILGPAATPDAIAKFKQQLGLDKPAYDQYWDWLTRAVHGDFGQSLVDGTSVATSITTRLPVTLSLIGLAIAVTAVVGAGLGVLSAVRGGIAGRIADLLAWIGFALPAFWIGAILIAVFAVRFRALPASGYTPISDGLTPWLQSMALPALALALSGVSSVTQQTREAMLDAARSEYVRMARANGAAEWSIVFRHTLKNAGTRITTLVGLQTVGLLGGAVVIETVFALPGLGNAAVNATLGGDLPTIQAMVVVFTLIVVVVNLLVDLSYIALNPAARSR